MVSRCGLELVQRILKTVSGDSVIDVNARNAKRSHLGDVPHLIIKEDHLFVFDPAGFSEYGKMFELC